MLSATLASSDVIPFTEFFTKMFSSPELLVTALLTLGVIFVNGWTDAPNAIATCISTRSISPHMAIFMAAVFNFLGVLVMTLISRAVASTIYNMVDFGSNTGDALIGLCAALFAIVVWAVAAWWFGIPTSESHALIAGLSGAAIAMHNSISGINMGEWVKVIVGLGLSSILGFFMGWAVTKIITFSFSSMDRRQSNKFFKNAQIGSGAAMAFMHGAQDGQKFIGVFLLGIAFSEGNAEQGMFNIPLWLMIVCSVVMAVGTSVGGGRIIKAVGMDMVKLEKHQGFSADLAAAGCLLIASVFGIPVSTTHTKTTSIMGVGAAKRIKAVNWSVVKNMVLAWFLTFPGCGLISYGMVKLFLLIF